MSRGYLAERRERTRIERRRENNPRYGVHGARHHRCPNCGAGTRLRLVREARFDPYPRRDRVCRRCTSRLVRLFRWLRGAVP